MDNNRRSSKRSSSSSNNNNNNNSRSGIRHSSGMRLKSRVCDNSQEDDLGVLTKITAITRAFTLIYTLSLLTIFTRVQLNLLGRRSYLSSVISLATPANESTIRLEDHDDDDLTHTLGDDLETNRRYLAFSWYLLHPGWKKLMERVQEIVTEVFSPLNPREDISLSKLSELTVQVRMKMEGSTEEERRYASLFLRGFSRKQALS